MLPQEESLAILSEFLREHNCEKINGISIETIVDLGRMVLQANTFVCGNKFYRQIIGGAMGSAFTLTLANIFMWKWQKQIILPKLPSIEIYGRFVVFYFNKRVNEIYLFFLSKIIDILMMYSLHRMDSEEEY